MSRPPRHQTNFQGQDFQGQTLVGADFSFADIRGANFNQAMLIGANFSHAKTGLPTFWVMNFVLLTSLLSILAGLISGYAGALVGDLVTIQKVGRAIFGAIFLILFIPYVFVVIRKGLGSTLTICVEIAAGFLVALLAFLPGSAQDLLTGANFSLLALGGILAGVGNIAIAIALNELIGLPKSKPWLISLAIVGIIVGILFGVRESDISYLIAGLVGLSNILLGLYVGFQALVGDSRYQLILKSAIMLVMQRGTRFCNANLTDANFTQANLCNADFCQAILTRTNWLEAQNLNKSRVEDTYLVNERILKLLIHREGAGESFENLNLQGLNLQVANLQDASFIGANLSETTLEGANLTGAKLKQTQLYQSNLTGACLTGAYIQDWGISTNTQFEGIICDYIYMQLPTKDDPDPCRKPDNKQETFKPGDFANFIAPIIKTLDLYQQQNVDPRRMATTYKTIDLFHHEGIDPSAAAIALKQLAEQYPEAGLEVVALEGRGDEKIRLQARVTGETDRSQLSAEYFDKYQEATALPYGDLQSLLAAITEKDQRIQSLENMVMTAMQSDKFYVETYYDLGKQTEETQPVKKILVLTANPQNSNQRRLEAEVREIQTGLERAKKRDQFEIIAKWAVRTNDLRRALLDYEPQIVHFSGYGTTTKGLALESETGHIQIVHTAALTSLFEVFKDKVECVLLSACYSVEQAEAISQFIPYVIGMNHEIGASAALEFTVGFYDALGAGRSIDDAFKLGCIAIELEGLPEKLTPVLKKKE
ncbi:putative low-complexity protein [Leptolyngbya sp. PCC 7375]|nr:putative low-complexity protein [Leptolyngbya sp. PCC 7375]